MASTSKRKRDRGNHKDAPAAKRPTKPSSLGSPTDAVIAVKRDLLEQCYPFVQSLRQYLLAKLPLSSRLRRKKIASLSSTASPANAETSLGHLLDTTLVATFEQADAAKESPDLRWELWQSFSQKDDSYVTISDSSAAVFSQAEVSRLCGSCQ
jgi:telomerase reverse transcriptase